MNSSKLFVNPSPEFIKNLEELIVKIELFSSLPVDLSDYEKDDGEGYGPLIDPKTFQPSQNVQGILTVEMMKETCNECRGVLENLKNEIIENGTFETLVNYVEDICGKYLKDAEIIEEYDKIKEALEKVENDLKQFEQDKHDKEHELENKLLQNSLEFQQVQHDGNMEKDYVEKWVENQIKQDDLIDQQEEEKINSSIKMTDFKAYNESLCGKWTKEFYERKIKELNEEATRMSLEYEVKMEEAELNYQIIKNEKRYFDEMVENETKIFEFRQKQIDDYLAYKAKKAADKKLRELQEVKSIRIQAWWRGVMVRCYLGSFKKFKKRAREIRREMRAAKSQKNKNNKKGK